LGQAHQDRSHCVASARSGAAARKRASASRVWLFTVVMERKKSDKSHVDVIIGVLACVTVVLLACIAAAISYSHMHELAIRHGETGWRAHAFPLSVDGIEPHPWCSSRTGGPVPMLAYCRGWRWARARLPPGSQRRGRCR